MSKRRLGPWHLVDVNPVHVGVYETKDTMPIGRRPEYRKWDGEKWLVFNWSIYHASIENKAAVYTVTKWRGVLR